MEPKFDLSLYRQIDNMIIDVNDPNVIIKDANNFQQTYMQSVKNLQNHILESFIQLLSSLSSNILHAVFYDVIQTSVFLGSNPFENQLATDLRIYLLKITDKIVNICQGDLILSQNLLNSMVHTMIPDPRTVSSDASGLGSTGQQLGETAKLKQRTSETVSLACSNLWQTFRQKLFTNYSYKGMKTLLEWIFNNLVSLAEHSDDLTQEEQQKLTLVFDIIEIIAAQQASQQESLKPTFEQPYHLRKVQGRETRLNQSIAVDNQLTAANEATNQPTKQPLIKVTMHSVHSLELYALINPILFWLDYSIEKQDRLPLFKVIWKTLNKLLMSLLSKKIDIDNVTIILPVLYKINAYCQSSSPPLEMLQFLLVVLADFWATKQSRELQTFLSVFLSTLAKCIPHNLHDEVFLVCEQLLELSKDIMKQEHIKAVIDALIDKYTMRSKEHKRLAQQFINIVLERSVLTLDRHQGHIVDRVPQNTSLQDTQLLQAPNRNLNMTGHLNLPTHPFTQISNDEIDNYEYERESSQYLEEEEEEEDSHHQHQQLSSSNEVSQRNRGTRSNQDIQESPVSQRIVHNPSQQHQHAADVQQWGNTNQQHHVSRTEVAHNLVLKTDVQTYFDFFCKAVFFNNSYEPVPYERLQDQILLELYFEKISIFMQLLKAMDQKHIPLFQKLINADGLKVACIKLFLNERSTMNAVELIECLSSYYMTNCAPKNIYEHPLSLVSGSGPQANYGAAERNSRNNNQNSQSSGHQQPHFSHHNRESSRNSFMSNNNIQPIFRQLQFEQHNPSPLNQQLTAPQMAQSPQEVDEDLLLGSGQDEIITDEIDIINKERLVLISVYTSIIRLAIEQNGQLPDAYLQFNTLNLIDNLFSNLMPVPNFQNTLIQEALSKKLSGRQGTPPSQTKINQAEIPDLEKMVIFDNLQAYLQAIEQQQQLQNTSQQVSCIMSEFECQDPRYLHARLQFALKVWPFMESSLFQSSWSNIRSICYGLFCQILKIDISEYKKTFQNKVKQVLFPLLNKLLYSKESESKAGGLNILGAFCGLGHDFSALNHFKVSNNLKRFRKNSGFVSLAIWEQVFNLQEDWDQTIREAAAVIVQICAPRESIKHFNNIVNEKYQLRLSSLINTFKASATHSMRQKQYANEQPNINSTNPNRSTSDQFANLEEEIKQENKQEQSPSATQRLSLFNNFFQSTQSMRGVAAPAMTASDFQNISDDSEEDKRNVTNGQAEEDDEDYFYVDQYHEEQVKEIISIFKNDYKPPKNLWIEKNAISYQNNQMDMSLGQHQNFEGEDAYANSHDVFEDNIVNKMNQNAKLAGNAANQDTNLIDQAFDHYFNKSEVEKSKETDGNQEESEYLIFERHFESDKDKKSSQLLKSQQQSSLKGQEIPGAVDNLNHEDLGIIDLDDEGDDQFDDLDDDKLPVLKNTYSKKNRPNNSKSVAIGSRSQGGQLKDRILEPDNEKIMSPQQKKDAKLKIEELAEQPDAITQQEQYQGFERQGTKESLKLSHLEKEYHEMLAKESKSKDQDFAKQQVSSLTDPSMKEGEEGLDSQDRQISEYEQMIAQTISNLNLQLLSEASRDHDEEQKEESPLKQAPQAHKPSKREQLNETATLRLNKRIEESVQQSQSKQRLNKSFDKQAKLKAAASPLRSQQQPQMSQVNKTPNLRDQRTKNDSLTSKKQQPHHITIAQINPFSSGQQSSQPLMKKTNDPSHQTKPSYAAQAFKLKSIGMPFSNTFPADFQTVFIVQQQTKKDQQNKPGQLSQTQPGPLTAQVLSSSKRLITSPNSKAHQLAYGQSNTRKRKSEYQRKSEVPAFSSKKFLSNTSISHTNKTSDNASKSAEKYSMNNSAHNTALLSQSSLYTKAKQPHSLVNQAKQSFVSRAKSQSYLNNVMGGAGSTSSVGSQVRQKKGSSFNQRLKTAGSSTRHSGQYGRAGCKQTTEDESNSSNVSQGASQAHKGYFSNDEMETSQKSPVKVKGRVKINDLFSSEEKDNQRSQRASSLKPKKHQSRMEVIVLSDEEEEEKHPDYNQANDMVNLGLNDIEVNDVRENEYLKTKAKLEQYKQLYIRGKKQSSSLNKETRNPQTVVLDMSMSREDEDNEGVFSREEVVRGQRELSCIDEEEDLSDGKQAAKQAANYCSSLYCCNLNSKHSPEAEDITLLSKPLSSKHTVKQNQNRNGNDIEGHYKENGQNN